MTKKDNNRGMRFLDLIQEGSMGPVPGAEWSEYCKGFTFSASTRWWTWQVMTRGCGGSGVAGRSAPVEAA
ncbi:hypothetical protein [Deinococcus hopiensis]|uniref:hypothetical protein n=1 Tax=Deinococcus hopiensis TaxID=309885 RepID=UPI00111BEE63|nr:hypothetical protein [Deinococcus hopiensis]